MKTLKAGQNSLSPDRDLNPDTPENEAGNLPTQPLSSVIFFWFLNFPEHFVFKHL
jgi:hypothetical protein